MFGLDNTSKLKYYRVMKLETWRKKQNLNNTQLAKKLRVHPSYITHLVSGNRIPSFTLLHKIDKLSGGAVSFKDFNLSRKK